MTNKQKETQFGGPRANRSGNPSTAVKQREFYKWVECVATEDELNAYLADESNPAGRRNFIRALMKVTTLHEFFELTNQTHGMPKQVVEQTELMDVRIKLED